MSDVEQIYALFVEANPVADPATLPETYEEARPMLRAVPTDVNGTDEDERYVSIPGHMPRRTRHDSRRWRGGDVATPLRR
jgi:hypothetical protein